VSTWKRKAWQVGYLVESTDQEMKTEIVYGDDIFIVADRLKRDLRLNKYTIVYIERDDAYDI
jgi:hypothetical protein